MPVGRYVMPICDKLVFYACVADCLFTPVQR